MLILLETQNDKLGRRTLHHFCSNTHSGRKTDQTKSRFTKIKENNSETAKLLNSKSRNDNGNDLFIFNDILELINPPSKRRIVQIPNTCSTSERKINNVRKSYDSMDSVSNNEINNEYIESNSLRLSSKILNFTA